MLIKVQKNKTYVVAGAGYAGRMAAVRMRTRCPHARIVVIDPSSVVVERARYHEVVGGWKSWKIPMTRALPKGAEHLCGWVEAIDAKERVLSVRVDGVEQRLAADGIVVALGSRSKGIEAKDATISVLGAEDEGVLECVKKTPSKEAPLVVIGTGFTGVEIATVLAERHGPDRVLLVGKDKPGHLFTPAAQTYIERYLKRVGLRVILDGFLDVQGEEVLLTSGMRLKAGAVIACMGFSYPSLGREMEWPVDAEGRVLVEPSLALPQSQGVFVAGDLAACHQGGPKGSLYRPACATAMPMGVHVGEQLARLEKGEEPLPFSLGYFLQCLALGRHDGIVQFVDGEDHALQRFWSGRRAAWSKELILKMTWQAPALEKFLHIPMYRWIAAPKPQSEADGHTKPAL